MTVIFQSGWSIHAPDRARSVPLRMIFLRNLPEPRAIPAGTSRPRSGVPGRAFPLPSYQHLRFSCSVLLAAAIERLYDLNVGTTPLAEGAPHERPHKPLLLLAAQASCSGASMTAADGLRRVTSRISAFRISAFPTCIPAAPMAKRN